MWSSPGVATTLSWSALLFGAVASNGELKSGMKLTTPVPDRSFTVMSSPKPNLWGSKMGA